jgi:hypothetical protein
MAFLSEGRKHDSMALVSVALWVMNFSESVDDAVSAKENFESTRKTMHQGVG